MAAGAGPVRAQGISVVIPLHNKAATIGETLASVAAQTRPADEVVVVDDASSDGGGAVARAAGLTGLRLIQRDQPGPGGYAARNAGAAAAQCRWIALLDADDLWLPEHLATAAAAIAQAPDAGCLFLGYAKTDASGRRRDRPLPEAGWVPVDRALSHYVEGDLFHTNAAVIDRRLWERVGGFPTRSETRRGGDSEFWLRLLIANGGACFEPAVTSLYRSEHSGVISARNSGRRHPVRIATAELLAGAAPAQARLLRRLANRKTLQWIRHARNRDARRKWALFRSLYPGAMGRREYREALRSLLRVW